jgi:trk system potassium uptake protein TrkA
MRIVFVGAGELSIETAKLLIERDHEIVIIEENKDKIESLSDTLDCSFLHGDGSKPHILEEAGPEHADFLFCLTENDQYNIIAALVGRSLGYSEVIVHIHDENYLNICNELGLERTITPSKTISRYLADTVAGIDVLELSSLIKCEARFMMIRIDKKTKGSVADLDLPEGARVIAIYRSKHFMHVDSDSTLKTEDEALILTHSDQLAELKERFVPQDSPDEDKSTKKSKEGDG